MTKGYCKLVFTDDAEECENIGDESDTFSQEKGIDDSLNPLLPEKCQMSCEEVYSYSFKSCG